MDTTTLYPFICFYKGKQIDVMAETSYKAQQSAAVWFKAKKAYDITVMRADIVYTTPAKKPSRKAWASPCVTMKNGIIKKVS